MNTRMRRRRAKAANPAEGGNAGQSRSTAARHCAAGVGFGAFNPGVAECLANQRGAGIGGLSERLMAGRRKRGSQTHRNSKANQWAEMAHGFPRSFLRILPLKQRAGYAILQASQ